MATKPNKKNDADKKEVETTGHEWDGIQEFNNPMPGWWVWTFYATIIWAILYSVAYPAWPMIKGATPGLLGWSTRGDVAAEIQSFVDMNADLEAELASADLTQLQPDTPLHNYAIQSGRATFATYCSQCHGSGAAGSAGYPNLLDDDWLWGGDILAIQTTITHGIRADEDDDTQYSEMPAFADDYLSDEEIAQSVAFVQKLSGQDHDAALAGPGAEVFADNCSSCHMEDGTGDRSQGAPNLTDALWLFGSDMASIEHNVRTGPFGVMPAWGMNENFDAAKINAVAAYVHQLGGGE